MIESINSIKLSAAQSVANLLAGGGVSGGGGNIGKNCKALLSWMICVALWSCRLLARLLAEWLACYKFKASSMSNQRLLLSIYVFKKGPTIEYSVASKMDGGSIAM